MRIQIRKATRKSAKEIKEIIEDENIIAGNPHHIYYNFEIVEEFQVVEHFQEAVTIKQIEIKLKELFKKHNIDYRIKNFSTSYSKFDTLAQIADHVYWRNARIFDKKYSERVISYSDYDRGLKYDIINLDCAFDKNIHLLRVR